MKTIRLICGVLTAALLTCCTACTTRQADANLSSAIPQNESEKAEYDACLIAKKDTDVLYEYWYVYVDNDTSDSNALCGIPVHETTFLSHDKGLRQLDDVKPGTMIRFTVPDDFKDLLDPGYFNQTLSIETWGEHREDLYRAGLDCLPAPLKGME